MVKLLPNRGLATSYCPMAGPQNSSASYFVRDDDTGNALTLAQGAPNAERRTPNAERFSGQNLNLLQGLKYTCTPDSRALYTCLQQR